MTTTITAPVVSALTAGVLIMLQMLLMLRTALTRRSQGVSLGAGEGYLLRRSRRHGNLAENAAIFIACFAIVEMLGEPRLWMEIACGLFLFARLLHIVGLSQKEKTANIFRVAGVILTFAIGIGLGIRLLHLAAPLVFR